VKLTDPYGPTLEGDFHFIVVSPETHKVAIKINKLREDAGLFNIVVVLVPFVMAEDGLPISSERIAKGEID